MDKEDNSHRNNSTWNRTRHQSPTTVLEAVKIGLIIPCPSSILSSGLKICIRFPSLTSTFQTYVAGRSAVNNCTKHITATIICSTLQTRQFSAPSQSKHWPYNWLTLPSRRGPTDTSSRIGVLLVLRSACGIGVVGKLGKPKAGLGIVGVDEVDTFIQGEAGDKARCCNKKSK